MHVAVESERYVDPFEGSLIPSPVDAIEAAHIQVDRLEAAIRRQLPLLDLPPVHHFADGIYARELFIPAGTLLTGKIHKTQHINIISKGKITVWSAFEGVKIVEAPCTFVAEPGTRRVGYAHEDTICLLYTSPSPRD